MTPLRVVLHVATMNHYRQVVAEIAAAIRDSGLEAAAASLTAVVVGDGEIAAPSDAWTVIRGPDSVLEYEYPALDILHQQATTFPDCHFLYLHTKGVGRPKAYREAWRRYMLYAVVEGWRECVAALDRGHTCCGNDWIVSRSRRGHFCGNFWWAKGEYLASLCEPSAMRARGRRHERYGAEAWIGTGTACRPVSIQKCDVRRYLHGGHIMLESIYRLKAATITPGSVGIIIPTYGHFDYAHLAIESASKTPNGTVIVVDDASPDWPGERIVRGWLDHDTPFVIQRFYQHGGLSRSWNEGLSIARKLGLEYAVCGNSDLVFSSGWWEPIRDTLKSHTFAGPVTNAPGHVPMQDVSRYIKGYEADDNTIDETARSVRDLAEAVPSRQLNGFCFAGRVADFFEPDGRHPINPDIPLAGNEDDFFRRARRRGKSLAIVPKSFVFHYRSVTRDYALSRRHQGAVRLQGCTGCGRK